MDDAAVYAFVASHLGGTPVSVLFRHEHLSLAMGLMLDDGRGVVVKVRSYEPRHLACAKTHRALFDAGFPCPRLLAGPIRIDDSSVSVEEFTRAPAGNAAGLAPSAEASARALHRLMCLASASGEGFGLSSPPAWLAWGHPGRGLWPAPDDGPEDLNAVGAPAWLTDAARQVRYVLLAASAAPVIGHGDWEAQNVFWDGDRLAVVHDWDSLVLLPEAAIVGAAGGVFAVRGSEPSWPTLDNSRDFLLGYLDARAHARDDSACRFGGPWRREHDRVFWGAGVWVHVFNAQKAIARDQFGPVAERSREWVEERLALTRA